MTLVGLLLVPLDDAVRADLARWGVQRTVELRSQRYLEADVERASKGASVILFANPRRRWSTVMDALRTAALKAPGDVTLRFYQPAVTIDVRSRIWGGREERGLCPVVCEFEGGQGAAAYKLRRSVKDALADLLADELRALVARVHADHERVIGPAEVIA